MDSDNDCYNDGDLYDDSGNESPDLEGGSDDEENFIMDEDESSGSSSQKIDEEYHFEVSPSDSNRGFKSFIFVPILGPEYRGHCQSHGGEHQGGLQHYTDPHHHDQNPPEPLQVGQGEADGEILHRGPGGHVPRGQDHFPQQEPGDYRGPEVTEAEQLLRGLCPRL